MTTTILETEQKMTSAGDSTLDHFYCCDEDTALCGTDITDYSEGFDQEDNLCSVCDDLESTTDGCRVCEGGTE